MDDAYRTDLIRTLGEQVKRMADPQPSPCCFSAATGESRTLTAKEVYACALAVAREILDVLERANG